MAVGHTLFDNGQNKQYCKNGSVQCRCSMFSFDECVKKDKPDPAKFPQTVLIPKVFVRSHARGMKVRYSFPCQLVDTQALDTLEVQNDHAEEAPQFISPNLWVA